MDADHMSPVKPEPLRLVTSTGLDHSIRLVVDGEIDMATADALADAMTSILHRLRADRVVVDFAGVTFMDCSGVNALMTGYRLAQGHHIGFVLVNCQPNVLRVLELTGVDKVLTRAGTSSG
jgi:anti-anti-sigma factor